MKKVLFSLVVVFLFIPMVKADLTTKQADDLAEFTTNFVNEGNRRIGTDGFPLFAYMQGSARIEGYQSILHKVNYDYNKKNLVNAYKWTFDCASFASFIYYKTFNLILTQTYTNKIDEYSGLKIRSESANPYEVQPFFDDASRGEHFYFVKSNTLVSNLNYDELKKGDLVIIKGSHIMVYIGNGKIAHASNGAISNTNLGLEINDLSTLYGNRKVYIIRIKDGVINPNIACNKTIYFPDTKENIQLLKETIVLTKPTINYTLSTTEWTKTVEINFEFLDDTGLKKYSINGTKYNISGKNVKINKTISQNGTYKIELVNANDLVETILIEIDNIDDIAPVIKDINVVEYDNHKQLVVKAFDFESGLDDNSYSIDSGLTWNNNVFNVIELKNYEIVVKDKAGNITKKTINLKENVKVDSKINNVIFGEFKNDTQKVIITTLPCENCKIAVTTEFKIPSNMDIVVNNQYETYLSEGKYYVWLEYNGKILDNQRFTVKKDEKSDFVSYVLVIIIGIIILIIGYILLTKRRKNKI